MLLTREVGILPFSYHCMFCKSEKCLISNRNRFRHEIKNPIYFVWTSQKLLSMLHFYSLLPSITITRTLTDLIQLLWKWIGYQLGLKIHDNIYRMGNRPQKAITSNKTPSIWAFCCCSLAFSKYLRDVQVSMEIWLKEKKKKTQKSSEKTAVAKPQQFF